MGQNRSVAALVVSLLLVPVVVVTGRPDPAVAEGPIPAQWIVKQHTEILGRVPTASEWDTWTSFYSGATTGCSATSLATLGRQLATSGEFAFVYTDATMVGRGIRSIALVRAAFERDPTVADWTAHVTPYLRGTTSWAQVVDGVFAAPAFVTGTVPKVCESGPSSGFEYTPPIDVLAATGAGTSRTAQQVQSAIDTAAAAGGGTVALKPGEVVRVGATSNQQLVVKPGVTLTTTGAPKRYARMGRLVAAGPDGVVCGGYLCVNTGIVAVEPGGSLRNVWVDGQGTSPVNAQMANIEIRGSTPDRPTAVLDNRVTNPGRDGAGIRARGFSSSGTDCAGETIRGNLVTAYSARAGLDRMLEPQGVDGIDVHCEESVVESNTVVDATNAGIVLYGSYNRQRDETRPQRSRVADNTVVSAGLGAHVALGVDPTGECAGHVDARLVPCIDIPATRSFDGTVVRDNRFWTGPRTAFEIGLMVGSAPLWGDHRVPGSGGSYTGNSTGGIGARVNIGVSTLGMSDAAVSGNASSFALVDASPRQQWGKCPVVEEATPAADGCVIDGAPESGLERIKVASDGNRLVGATSGRTFTPWGMRTPAVSVDEVWDTDWNRIVEAFREIRRMGANIVRLKVQFHSFVDAPPTPPPSSTTTTTEPPTSTTEPPTSTTEPPPSTTTPPPSTEPPPSTAPPPSTEPTSTSEPTSTTEGDGDGGAFLTAALATETDQYGTPNVQSLEKLRDVIALAEQTGLYVELTGLRIDRDADTGTWYDQLDEQGRWAAQAVFWSAVAGAVKDLPAVAWLDLMSEPVASVGDQANWCVARLEGNCLVQFLTRTPNGRTQVEIAQQWATLMRDSIRTEGGDTEHLISVGLLPRGYSGFRGVHLAGIEDFTLVHMYPHADDPATRVDELQADIDEIKKSKPPGQPLVVDETFTYMVVETVVMEFVLAIRPDASGAIGHYFEQTPAQLTPPSSQQDALAQLFYKMFLSLTPTILDPITLAGGLPSLPPAPPPPPPPPTPAATVPGAPTNVVVTAGLAQIAVAYSPPASDGGSPIIKYRATCRATGQADHFAEDTTAPFGTITVAALTPGVTYTCTVRAYNGLGAGTESAGVSARVPTAPTVAPANVTAVPTGGAGAATVAYSLVPTSGNGGAPITKYRATCRASGQPDRFTEDTSAPFEQVTVTGMTNGVTYTCKARAYNLAGAGPESGGMTVRIGAPTAPGNVTNAPGAISGSIKITWTAAITPGTAPVLSHAVTCTASGSTKNETVGNVLTKTMGGLDRTKTYTCSITATNKWGTGPAKSATAGTKPR